MTKLGYEIKSLYGFSFAFLVYVFHSARVLTGELFFFFLAIFFTAIVFSLNYRALLDYRAVKLATACGPLFALFVWESNGLEAALKNWIYLQSSVVSAIILLYLNVGSLFFLLAFFLIAAGIIIEALISQPDYAAWLPGSRNHVMPILFSLILLSLFASKWSRLIEFNFFSFQVFFPISVLCIVSVLSVGLSGILTSLLLLIALSIFALNTFQFKKSIALILTSYSSIVLIAFWEIWSKKNVEVLVKLKNTFKEGSVENPVTRIDIWLDYFHKSSLVFGADYSQAYSGIYNLHNSFLLAHAKFGILFLVFPVLIIFAGHKLFNLGKQYQIFCFLLFASCFRGLFDTIYFSGSSYTYQLFALVLLPFLVDDFENKKRS